MEAAPTVFGILADTVPVGFQVLFACVFLVLVLSLLVRRELANSSDVVPPEGLTARNMVEVIRLKIRCKRLGIEAVDVAGGELVLRVHEKSRIDPSHLVRMLAQPDTPFRVSPDHRIYLELRRKEDALAESLGLLELLSPQEGPGAASNDSPAEAGETR